jgi:superkiller protein 3
MMTQSHHLCDTKLFAINVGALASVLLVLATPPMLAQTSHLTGQAQLNKSTAIGCETVPQNDLTFRLDAAGLYGQGITFDPNYLRQNEKELRQAIESSPFNLKAHLNLAEVLAGLGLERPSAYDEAIGIYRYVIKTDVTGSFTPAAELGIGNILALQHKYSEAIAQYQLLIQQRNTPPERVADAYRNTGTVLSQMCQYEAAIAAYKNAIATRPLPQFSFSEGEWLKELLKQQNRLAEIVPFYREQISQKPGVRRELLGNLGQVLLELKRFSEAERAYRDLIEVMRNQPIVGEDNSTWLPSAYIHLADALRGQGKRQESLAAYKSAAEIYQPGDVGLDAYPSLARDLQERGLPELASLILQKNLTFRPNDIYSLVNLGQLFEQLQKLPEAIDAYEKALKLQPKGELDKNYQQTAEQYLQAVKQRLQQ